MQLPDILARPAISLLGDTCYTTLITNLNLFDPPCLKLAISKALGLGIVLGAAIVKLPQIYKILRASSTRGLSQSSYLIETFASFIVLAYNLRLGFAFSTWGETVFIVAQNLMILALMSWYRGNMGEMVGISVAAAASMAVLRNESVVGMELLSWLQLATIPLFQISKIPQIWENYVQGNTGQLSAFVVFNYLSGSIARIFTTIQEVDDKIILMNYVTGTVFNIILAAQMVYYWNANEGETLVKKGTKKGKGKKKE